MLAGDAQCAGRALVRSFKKSAEIVAQQNVAELISDKTEYRVDGEVGALRFGCHLVMCNGAVVLDTSIELFPPLIGKERYETQSFKELAFEHGVVARSYRSTADMLGRIRHQPKGTALNTLRCSAEVEGTLAAAALRDEAKRVLEQAEIDSETLQPRHEPVQPEPQYLPSDLVEAALVQEAPNPQSLRVMRANPVNYEDPAVTVNLSVDDVGVKKQKQERPKRGGRVANNNDDASNKRAQRSADEDEGDKKRVHTTVAHVQMQGRTQMFAAHSVLSACMHVLAFLCDNDLLRWNLLFFVDGQRSLHATLLELFRWRGSVQPILDWHHLDKKCQQQLSLALNNRRIRNEVLKGVLALLWHGNIDAAMAYLHRVDPKHIKSEQELEKLVGYFERNRRCIPCYSVRKKLGLRNSSNQGEKANDLLVSSRQKHNGMSWSPTGSLALSTLTALVKNGKHKRWFETQTVDFRLAA